jgi:hypothetical protein
MALKLNKVQPFALDESETNELLTGTPLKEIGDDKFSEADELNSQATAREPCQNYVKFEFKISGMTCVACSGAIERLMNNEFKKRGMVDQQIALLTHKMTVSFE